MVIFGKYKTPGTFLQDYTFGKKEEKRYFKLFKKFFSDTLQYNTDEFSSFDFEDETTAIEMKSRHIYSTEYSDVMIKTLKIENCENESRDCYLVFKFIDCLAYIHFDKEKFKHYKKKLMLINSRTDYTEKPEYRTFIPFGDLSIIKKYCMLE